MPVKKSTTPSKPSTRAVAKPVLRKSPARKTAPVKTVAKKPASTALSATVSKTKKNTKKSAKDSVKIKVVRDSFSMPENEYAKIAELKKLALKNGSKAKKNELLRAGLLLLSKMSATQLETVLSSLAPAKTARAKK